VVVDRVAGGKGKIFWENLHSRLTDSLEQALNLSAGNVVLAKVLDKEFSFPQNPKKFNDYLFSELFACPIDNVQIPEIEPRTFSFNSPHGACASCSGLGKILKVDPNLIFADGLTITEGGILPFATMFEHDTWYSRLVLKVCEEIGLDPRKQISELTNNEKLILLYGTGNKEYRVEGTNRRGRLTNIWWNFRGIVNELEKRYQETVSDYIRAEIEKYMRQRVCAVCEGRRLKKEALSITINNFSIADITHKSITETYDWIASLSMILSQREKEIGKLIIKEVTARLDFLKAVGLE
jgi:excinuclease ABC subunit A